MITDWRGERRIGRAGSWNWLKPNLVWPALAITLLAPAAFLASFLYRPKLDLSPHQVVDRWSLCFVILCVVAALPLNRSRSWTERGLLLGFALITVAAIQLGAFLVLPEPALIVRNAS